MNLNCKFTDGVVRSIPIENINLHVGRGVWGAAYVRDLALDTDAIYCDCDYHPDGSVMLGSSQTTAQGPETTE